MDHRSTVSALPPSLEIAPRGRSRMGLRQGVGFVGQTILLAMLYVSLGRLGLLLAEPPGYAAPIWLPAGIALIGVLLRGNSALLGVWLGSFLINSWISWSRWGAISSGDLLIVALIAVGAGLQAWVGASLIRTRIGFPPPLTRGKDILLFLLLAGPLSCVVNATLGVGVLRAWGILPWSRVPMNWLEWWVGDTLGALLVSIILMPAVGAPRSFWKPRIHKVTVPIGLLTGVILALFGAIRAIEREQIQETLTTWSIRSTRMFERWFGNAQVGVMGWFDYVQTAPDEAEEARQKTARGVLEYHDTLRAVAVVEMIHDKDRARFEADRTFLIHAGPILEPDAKGDLVPAGSRDWYIVPTMWSRLDSYPSPGRVDFAHEMEVRELLLRACETASPQAISTRRLPISADGTDDLAVFHPLYRTVRPPTSPAERRASLWGFSLSVVRMQQVLDNAIEQVDPMPIRVAYSIEPAGPDEGVSLSIKGDDYLVRVPARHGLAEVRLSYFAGLECVAKIRSRYVGVVFLLGLIIVGLFGVQLLLVTGETAIVTEEVQRRTAELRAEIAERGRAEVKRRLFEEKLRETQKLESLGVLAGGIAHDFNNILTSILGYASLGERQLPLDSPVRAYLGHIDRSSRRAADLCQQMLAYAGKGRFVVGPQDLSHLVEDTADLLRLSISKKAELTLDLMPGLPRIEADENQLRQVVMNLVMNASEAIGDGGGSITLTARVRRVERQALDAMLHGPELPEGDYVCLDVADTGCGMDEATRGRIFEPFYTTKFTGRGLGLAAVLGIIRSHGGALRVDSALGVGTSFRLLFPPSASHSIDAPGVPEPSLKELEGAGKLLVVDDEDGVRNLTVTLLESIGFAVLEARDGQEAIAQFSKHRDSIRAVLLDLTMPRLDGQQAFAEIHKIAPQTPVLLMSGFTASEVRTRFASASPAGFLQKPFGAEELLTALGAVLK